MAEEKGSDQKLTIITADLTAAVVIILIALALLGVYIDRLIDWYRGFLEWFYAQDWLKVNTILSIIFFPINATLFGFIIFTLRRHTALNRVVPEEKAVAHEVLPKEEVRESWSHIRELANSSSSSDWNMAILRADALLDDILKHLGYEGDTIAERLQIVDPTKLVSLERVRSAHRLRNMIAHDPMEQHTRETIIHALRSYEQALKELGMMEEEA